MTSERISGRPIRAWRSEDVDKETRQKNSAQSPSPKPTIPGRRNNKGTKQKHPTQSQGAGPERRVVRQTLPGNATIGEIIKAQEGDQAEATSLAGWISTHGLPDFNTAQQELRRLEGMKARFWRDEAKAAHKFAHTILAAFIDNKRPQDIKAPDGSSFLWPTEEQIESQQKSSIRRCYSLSVRIQRGDAIPKSEALAELRWLTWVDPATWQKVDNDHYRFVKQVLGAVRVGRQPSDIRKPDGDHFVWPTIEVGVDASGGDVDPPVEYGVLKARGYRVGKSARPDSERWVTLRRVYEEPLDDLTCSVINLDEWGHPRSARRLRKLANTIASFTRNMKRRSDGSDLAVSHWKADLNYLKRTYYDGKHEPYFSWPQASAQR